MLLDVSGRWSGLLLARPPGEVTMGPVTESAWRRTLTVAFDNWNRVMTELGVDEQDLVGSSAPYEEAIEPGRFSVDKEGMIHEVVQWRTIGMVAGLVAVAVYPVLIFVSLARIPQVVLAASFGPALAVASIALWHVLRAHRRTPSSELAAMSNVLAGGLVTAMLIVQLAINYSTAPATTDQLETLFRDRLWDVVLGLDVSFDIFIGLGTLLFAVNMIKDPRFGRTVGWAGVFVALVPLLGANLFYFPDPPYTQGFPHVGIFIGIWYLAVVMLMVRDVRRSSRSDGVDLRDDVSAQAN